MLCAALFSTMALLGAAPQDPPAGGPPVPAERQDPDGGLVRVTGTSVRLVPPAGFTPARDYPGFQHGPTQSSLMVISIPGPYTEVAKGFETDEGLKSQGMTLIRREARPMGEHAGMYLVVDQEIPGVQVKKGIWAFGTQRETILVMGICFAAFAEAFFPKVEEAVLTATWNSGEEIDPFEGLDYRLGDSAGLRLFTRTGNALTYTQDGKGDDEGVGKAMFTVSPSIQPAPAKRKKAFARRRVEATGNLKEVLVESHEPVQIDGLGGFETVATGRSASDEIPLLLYQVILFEEQRYWLIQGLFRIDQRKDRLDAYRKMARSLRRKQAKPAPETGEGKGDGG